MVGGHAPAELSPSSVEIRQSFERGEVSYTFYSKPCSCCSQLLYFISRVDGARISCFQIAEEKTEHLDAVIDELHLSFAVDVSNILRALENSIGDVTSSDAFTRFIAEDLSNYRIRALDRARLILKKFSAEGKLDYLEQNADSLDDDFVASFVLGYLASENWWIINHEDAVFEGYRQQEARKAGRPLAVHARLRIGRRSRLAVINAAKEIYAKEPRLRRNDSKTAVQIASLKLPHLRKTDGTYLGEQAIIKHLRVARNSDQL
jgi:hypothetical protein